MTSSQTVTEVNGILALFPLLHDTPAVFEKWRELISSLGVCGKGAHDARLVAAMACHGLTHLLTFNDQDFRRYAGMIALHPSAVLQPRS
jgi:hypothetical protein